MTEERTRTRLSDIKIAQADAAAGIVCSRCGCRHQDVLYTRQLDNRIKRVRQCRHCGRRITTFERAHAAPEADPPTVDPPEIQTTKPEKPDAKPAKNAAKQKKVHMCTRGGNFGGIPVDNSPARGQ